MRPCSTGSAPAGQLALAVTIAWSTITVAADADIVFAVALGYALGIYSMWALRRD